MTSPPREPYCNVLVNRIWGKGRLSPVEEYTRVSTDGVVFIRSVIDPLASVTPPDEERNRTYTIFWPSPGDNVHETDD